MSETANKKKGTIIDAPNLDCRMYLAEFPPFIFRKSEALNTPSLAITDLPTELLDEILGRLDLIDLVAVKLTCKRLCQTRKSLSDCLKEMKADNPWDTYTTRVWLEKPDADELLCATCRQTHPLDMFFSSYKTGALEAIHPRLLSGLTRSCRAPDSAIELGYSRLTSTDIKDAMNSGPSSIVSEANEKHARILSFPSSAHICRVEAALRRAQAANPYEVRPRSPYTHFNFDHIVVQRFSVQDGKVTLCSSITLTSTPFADVDPPAYARQAGALDDIRCWFTKPHIGGNGQGGLWVCPHVPMGSARFAEAVLHLLEHFRRVDRLTVRDACGVCGAKWYVFRGVFHEGEIYPVRHHGVNCVDLTVIIEKDMGPLGGLKAEGEQGGFNDRLALHLSRRIREKAGQGQQAGPPAATAT